MKLEKEDRERLLLSFSAGIVVVLLVLAGFYWSTRGSGPAGLGAQRALPFGVAEQNYASNIRFENLKMSRFANMFHQEVTYMNGDIWNGGPRNIRAMDVTVEFHDPFHQVVLREARRVVSARERPLESGERRDFQIGFESIPAEWDHRFPLIRVTGLELE